MEKERVGFIPLNEIKSKKVSFEGDFPDWFPQGEIGLNLRRVHRLCNLGGLRHLSITLVGDGETSKSNHTVVGFNQNGEALAGKVNSSKLVPTHVDKVEQGVTYNVLPAARWIHGHIDLNFAEMSQRIKNDEKGQVSVRSPRPWAKLINEALCQGVGKLGINNCLYFSDPRGWLIIVAFNYPYLTLLNGIDYLEYARLGVLVGGVLTTNVLIGELLGMMAIRDGGEEGQEIQCRRSLIPGPQLDRAFLIAALTKIQPLVKEI